MRRFSLGVAFVLSALLLASISVNAEEPEYENPELQLKFNLKQSDVSSNIPNHDILRNFVTFGLTKRINLNVQ